MFYCVSAIKGEDEVRRSFGTQQEASAFAEQLKQQGYVAVAVTVSEIEVATVWRGPGSASPDIGLG